MRMILVLVMVALCSCTTEDRSGKQPTIVDDCGPIPTQPGRAVAFENGKALLDANQYVALDDYANAAAAWMSCAANH